MYIRCESFPYDQFLTDDVDILLKCNYLFSCHSFVFSSWLSLIEFQIYLLSVTMQHEGDFAFREAWFHLSDEYPIKYETDRLPPPIIADLNGDGKSEVVVATHDAKIQVFFFKVE